MSKDVISIILATGGAFHPDYTPIVDPYWEADDWHEAARGDGTSYGGVIDSVQRKNGESDLELLERASLLADYHYEERRVKQ